MTAMVSAWPTSTPNASSIRRNREIDRGVALAERVQAGTVGVNQGYSMDPAAPFGGVKASGYGRELGPEGLRSYLHTKSISVDAGPP